MRLPNVDNHYGLMSKILHWIVAMIVPVLLTVGFLLKYFQDTSWSDFFYSFHESLGLIVLVLMLFRLVWILKNPPPDLPATFPNWQRRLARFSHWLLYFTLIVMPLSGWIMAVTSGFIPRFLGLFLLPLPLAINPLLSSKMGNVHFFMAWTIIGLVSFHILAALKHFFINKDQILQRMLPQCFFSPSKKEKSPSNNVYD